MAEVIITLKIMPKTVEEDLKKIGEAATEEIETAGGKVGKSEIEPIAFGLNALKLIFIWPEEKGGTDPVEDKIKEIEGVMSAEVVDCRRAIG